MGRKRKPFCAVTWGKISDLDYDTILQNRSLYYAGIQNDETRLACKLHNQYRKAMRNEVRQQKNRD